ncbi:MAG: PIN domain-containing protein [Actinomycetota bacterium]|nr:PIN domain-containing protein [Actinomycetota bacterium]
MALTHLIDTSVLTRLGNTGVRDVVGPLVDGGRAGRASITDLEIGYSAQNAAEWDGYMESLAEFALVEIESRHFVRARHVQRLLASASQRGRKVPDLLVAAAAEDAGLVLLHYDADFDRIADVTGQRCEWVVPAGSVP